MPIEVTDGIRHLKNLKIGIDELEWWQKELHERRQARLKGNMAEAGFIFQRNSGGEPDFQWFLRDTDADGVLEVEAGPFFGRLDGPAVPIAIDVNGDVIELDATGDLPAAEVTIPDDGVWRTIVVRKAQTEYEDGTIAVTTGSAVIVGTGTKFTRFSGKTTDAYGRGSKPRIDAADSSSGNAGTYEFDTITDDLNATLVDPVNGTNESGLPFTIAGDFAVAPPADPDIHTRTELEWDIVARTLDPPAGGWLIVGDAMYDSATSTRVRYIDRRMANVYRPIARGGAQFMGVDLQPEVSFELAAGANFQRAELSHRTVYNPAGAPGAVDIRACRGKGNTILVAFLDGSGATKSLRIREFNQQTDLWRDPNGGPAVVVTTGTITSCAIVKVPTDSGQPTGDITHVVFWVVAKAVNMATSSDGGTTWSGATLIWQPTAVDASDDIDWPVALLTRFGRLLLAASYFDNTNGRWDIRWIYSDDYAATWTTNTNAGFIAQQHASDDLFRPDIKEGDDGTVWTVYQQDAGATIEVSIFHSTDKNTLLPHDINTSRLISQGRTDVRAISPALWVSPDGTPCVVYGDTQTANHADIRLVVVGNNGNDGLLKSAVDDDTFYDTLIERLLFRDLDGAGATNDPHLCTLVQGRGGQVHFIYSGQFNALNIEHLPLRPVAMPVTMSPHLF